MKQDTVSELIHMRHVLAIVLVAIFASINAFAQSPDDKDLLNPDRPGIADGSNVVGRGRFQPEMGAQQEFHHESGSRERTFFLPLLLRFGISARWEGRVEGNTCTRTR